MYSFMCNTFEKCCKRFKIIRNALLIPAILIGAVFSSVSAYAQISVEVNGSPVEFDSPPVIINERTMLPIRAVSEQMGLKVSWNEADKTVTISNYVKKLQLTIDSTIMKDNGNDIALDTAPMIINDRTCLPVRAVTESFGAEVNWNGEQQLVSITAPDTNKLIQYHGAFKNDEISYYYSDSIFEELSDFNYRLSVLSAVAALASNSENDICDFLKNNGFYDIRTYNYNKDFSNLHAHKSDYTLARKVINNQMIIAVIIRGTSGNEWYSNFDVYKDANTPSDTHYGFTEASKEIYNEIKDYIGDNDCTIWLCGHSRGGASANLTAKMLLDDNKKVTAYTFAAPNVTQKADLSVPIYNFVSENDIITSIPLSDSGWNYAKNGKTVSLQHYDKDNMKTLFSELTGEEYKPIMASDVENTISALNNLAPTPQQYYTASSDNICVYQYFTDYIVPMLIGNSYLGLTMLIDPVYGSLTRFFVTHSGGEALKKSGITIENYDNANGINYEHCMESYLSKLIYFNEEEDL